MTLQIEDTASHFELKQNTGGTPINGARGEDIIIAGAMSEWVLAGLQQWRRVARQSSDNFRSCPNSIGEI